MTGVFAFLQNHKRLAYYVITPGLLMSAVVTAQENRSWLRSLLISCIESRTDVKPEDKVFKSEN